ncbi:hypothetical protein F5Y18DRAFT_413666 [Xylariaceae sp. FL1019]|nr:hypothetical protein F5Y18DRAFT_413666 [Xylariaceae sp. FL1019]
MSRQDIPLALSEDWTTLLHELKNFKNFRFTINLRKGSQYWCVILSTHTCKPDGTLALLAQYESAAREECYQVNIGEGLAEWLSKKAPNAFKPCGEAMVLRQTWDNLPFVFAWAYYPIPPEKVGDKIQLPDHIIYDHHDSDRRGRSPSRMRWGSEQTWTPNQTFLGHWRDQHLLPHPILERRPSHVRSNSISSSRFDPDVRTSPGHFDDVHHYSRISEKDRRHSGVSTYSPSYFEVDDSHLFSRTASPIAQSHVVYNDLHNHGVASHWRKRLLTPEDAKTRPHRARHSGDFASYIPRERSNSHSGCVSLPNEHEIRHPLPSIYYPSTAIPHRASVEENYRDDRGRPYGRSVRNFSSARPASYGPDSCGFEAIQPQRSQSQVPSRSRPNTDDSYEPFSRTSYPTLAGFQSRTSSDGRHDLSYRYGGYSSSQSPRGWPGW